MISESTLDKELVAFAAKIIIKSNSQRRSATKNEVRTGFATEMSEI